MFTAIVTVIGSALGLAGSANNANKSIAAQREAERTAQIEAARQKTNSVYTTANTNTKMISAIILLCVGASILMLVKK